MRILIQLLKNSKWACLALVLSFSTTTSYAQWSDITGFEQGWGIWNDGGSDAYRLYEANSVLPGSYCARLRDNSGVSSSIYTNNLNLGGHSSVNIQFQYLAESMEHGEDFFLEYSSNGGSTYEKIETYTRGVHFNNGEKKSENVTVNKNFNDQCRFRFRCDASSNYDMIYLDDIKINAGGSPVNVYWWQNSGDVYYTTLNAGHQWDVSSYEGHKWRVVDTNNDWNHLLYDQSYTMNGDCDQTWNIHPDYCNQPAQCNQKKLWIKALSMSTGGKTVVMSITLPSMLDTNGMSPLTKVISGESWTQTMTGITSCTTILTRLMEIVIRHGTSILITVILSTTALT